MFPIPFNFPFRKKDGSVTSIGSAIESGGGSYTLPTASASTKGGVKIGSGLSMSGEVLNNSNPTPYTLPTASASVKGGVKVGSGLTIDGEGVLSTSGGGGATLTEIDTTPHDGNQFTVNNVDLSEHDGLLINFAYDSNLMYNACIIMPSGNTGADVNTSLINANNGFSQLVSRSVSLNTSTKVLTIAATHYITFNSGSNPTMGIQTNIGYIKGIYYIDF